jgi:hypothetical protein
MNYDLKMRDPKKKVSFANITRAFPASPLRKEYILGIALSEGGTKRLQKNDIYLSAEDQSGKSSQDNLF